MPIKTRHLAILLSLALTACALGGCASVNAYLAAGASDNIPQWMGGMPADVPPRPGTAKYDEYMKEQERKRLTPAPPKEDPAQAQSQAQSPSAGLAPVH
jgi:hypothetical protein